MRLRQPFGPWIVVPIAVVAVAALAAIVAGAAAAKTVPSAPNIRCSNGVVDRIRGRTVCIHVGGKCIVAHNAKYRKHGFTCVNGRLRRYVPPASAPTPSPPPPPPPPPPATPGHYKGMTSQNEDFEFDVTSDGLGVTGLITGQINESCTPSGGLYGGNLHFGSYTVPVATDGSFKIDVTLQGTLTVDQDSYPTQNHVTITGRFSGATATGNMLETTSFTIQGTAYSCSSNPQTWTATRIG